jgi:methionyl-tRNA formyltransferase
MEEGLDSGPVYARRALAIGDRETAGELQGRLARLGGEILLEQLEAILAGRLPAIPQDSRNATHAGKFVPADARLDWNRSATELGRQVRACNPVPGAWFELAAAGTVLKVAAEGIDVACGEGVIRLLSLQRPGRGRVSAREFGMQQKLEGLRLTA